MRVVQAATCDRCCRHFRQYQRAAHARRRARSARVHGISRLSADIKDVAVQSDPGVVWAYAPDGRTTPGSSDESGPPEAVLTEEDLRQPARESNPVCTLHHQLLHGGMCPYATAEKRLTLCAG